MLQQLLAKFAVDKDDSGITYCSNCILLSINPAKIDVKSATQVYIILTLSPKVATKSTIMIGLSSGEANKKVKVGPNPALALSSPRNMGMVEQLQKGVIAPIKAAKIYPRPCDAPKSA